MYNLLKKFILDRDKFFVNSALRFPKEFAWGVCGAEITDKYSLGVFALKGHKLEIDLAIVPPHELRFDADHILVEYLNYSDKYCVTNLIVKGYHYERLPGLHNNGKPLINIRRLLVVNSRNILPKDLECKEQIESGMVELVVLEETLDEHNREHPLYGMLALLKVNSDTEDEVILHEIETKLTHIYENPTDRKELMDIILFYLCDKYPTYDITGLKIKFNMKEAVVLKAVWAQELIEMGEAKNRKLMVRALYEDMLPIERIAKASGCTEAEILEIISEGSKKV